MKHVWGFGRGAQSNYYYMDHKPSAPAGKAGKAWCPGTLLLRLSLPVVPGLVAHVVRLGHANACGATEVCHIIPCDSVDIWSRHHIRRDLCICRAK